MISLTHANFSHHDPGFRVLPDVLAPSEIESIGAMLRSGAVEHSGAGARHLMRHPAVNWVAHDARVISIARRFVGAEAIPFRATLFDKSPRNNWLVAWHQDTALPLQERREIPGWGPWSVKAGIRYARAPASPLSHVIALRVHIDDSRADNGPLRVLPRTHTLGVLSDAEIGRLAREIRPVECTAPIGGIVAMRPLLVHASSKTVTDHPRRVLHIEYADSLEMGNGLALAIA